MRENVLGVRRHPPTSQTTQHRESPPLAPLTTSVEPPLARTWHPHGPGPPERGDMGPWGHGLDGYRTSTQRVDTGTSPVAGAASPKTRANTAGRPPAVATQRGVRFSPLDVIYSRPDIHVHPAVVRHGSHVRGAHTVRIELIMAMSSELVGTRVTASSSEFLECAKHSLEI